MNDDLTKLSPAKINLYLEVLEKTSNGYHNIESLMTFCDFGDIIRIKKAKNFKFTIDGPFSKKLSLKDNVVLNKNFYIFTGSTVGVVPILKKGLYIGKIEKLGSVKVKIL